MRKIAVFVFVLLSFSCFSQQNFVFGPAPAAPGLLPANWINSGFGERDFALSPDGTELFYTAQLPPSFSTAEQPKGLFQTILYSKKDSKGNWSLPEVASFAGTYSDIEPAFSFDGKKLFFASNRPVNGVEAKDYDIWSVEKENGKWGTAKNLGAPVNTPADEFYPSLAKNGNLYFTAAYKHGPGKEDIFMAAWENGTYKEPVALDTTVNSKTYEFNAFVSPDEDFIIFTSYGRKDDKGRGDLYMSIKDAAGKWQPAKNLVFINSTKQDYCPFVSFDRKILFFTSDRLGTAVSFLQKPASFKTLQDIRMAPQNGSGDIYWVSFDKLLESLK